MKVLGLTGGIGSGKTTMAKEFSRLGIPVFIADLESKKLLATDPQVIAAVNDLLGDRSYVSKNGVEQPDKEYIASQVFADAEKLKSLNSILHPAVRRTFEKWKNNQNYSYVVYEAAILFETGGHTFCDLTLLIAAPEQVRIERVMQRDNALLAQIKERMSHQWSQNRKLLLSDLILCNINLTESIRQVSIIHDFMLNYYI